MNKLIDYARANKKWIIGTLFAIAVIWICAIAFGSPVYNLN